MATLILMYHGIIDPQGLRKLHAVPTTRFHDQIQYLLTQPGCPILPWRAMTGPAGSGDVPAVALTFDDGHASDLESASFLRSQGLSALFFIATDHIGRAGYLTQTQVRQLHGLGMGIGSHSHHHVRLVQLADDQLRYELVTSKNVLESIVGEPVEHLSFPGGAYNGRVLDTARAAGYRYLLTSDWGINTDRQISTRVFDRVSVLWDTGLNDFHNLIHLRRYRWNRLRFRSKDLVKQMIGVDLYVKLRSAFIKFTG